MPARIDRQAAAHARLQTFNTSCLAPPLTLPFSLASESDELPSPISPIANQFVTFAYPTPPSPRANELDFGTHQPGLRV